MEWEPVRLPKELYKEITEIVNRTKFWVNEHEFIRDAVREKIAKCIVEGSPLVDIPQEKEVR